jgi:glycosyltransferase involved in cell wall biosynthesis
MQMRASNGTVHAQLTSCLCVTEDRRAFMTWLAWNYGKQDYAQRELVIVDSSRGDTVSFDDPTVTVVRCAPGSSIAQKRNLALQEARGSLVTWFDDDDWQHPRKLSILNAALCDTDAVAGSQHAWFVDLRRGRARRYDSRRMVLFTGSVFRRKALAVDRFDEKRERAADTAWLGSVIQRSHREPRIVPELVTWWLCHERNISNPATRYAFPHALADVRAMVDDADWGDTDLELDRLRGRVEHLC